MIMAFRILWRTLKWMFWNFGYTLSCAPVIVYLSFSFLRDTVVYGAVLRHQWLMVSASLALSGMTSALLVVWLTGLFMGWPEQEAVDKNVD